MILRCCLNKQQFSRLGCESFLWESKVCCAPDGKVALFLSSFYSGTVSLCRALLLSILEQSILAVLAVVQ